MGPGQGTWSVKRLPALERMLAAGRCSSLGTLCSALRSLGANGSSVRDGSILLAGAEDADLLNHQLLQAFLLNALAPFVQLQVQSINSKRCALCLHQDHPASLMHSLCSATLERCIGMLYEAWALVVNAVQSSHLSIPFRVAIEKRTLCGCQRFDQAVTSDTRAPDCPNGKDFGVDRRVVSLIQGR